MRLRETLSIAAMIAAICTSGFCVSPDLVGNYEGSAKLTEVDSAGVRTKVKRAVSLQIQESGIPVINMEGVPLQSNSWLYFTSDAQLGFDSNGSPNLLYLNFKGTSASGTFVGARVTAEEAIMRTGKVKLKKLP